ncbi:MAG: hypothetical protein AB1894_07520 [Chloroflexota bacterium]
MPSSKEELLLEDYKTSLGLLFHEDERKANLFTMFFLIQGGLFAFYSWLVSSSEVTATMLAVLAAIFSAFWFFVMERMRAFIRLRIYQLQQIEKKLGVITTITNEERLRSTGKTEIFGYSYKLSTHQRLFSVSKIESFLPVLVGIFWLLVAVGKVLNIG